MTGQVESKNGRRTASGEFDPPKARRMTWLVVPICIVIAIGLLLGFVFVPLGGHPGPGPSGFSPASGPIRVAPGSIGCQSLSRDVCYAAAVMTLYSGVSLSHLQFRVANETTPLNSNATPLPLGHSAQVAVLSSSVSIAGVWNVSTGSWTNGSGWVLPTNLSIVIILDTGLLSNSTLAGTWFWAELTGPAQASVGFPLQ